MTGEMASETGQALGRPGARQAAGDAVGCDRTGSYRQRNMIRMGTLATTRSATRTCTSYNNQSFRVHTSDPVDDNRPPQPSSADLQYSYVHCTPDNVLVRLVRGGISGTLGVIYNPQFTYTPIINQSLHTSVPGMTGHLNLPSSDLQYIQKLWEYPSLCRVFCSFQLRDSQGLRRGGACR